MLPGEFCILFGNIAIILHYLDDPKGGGEKLHSRSERGKGNCQVDDIRIRLVVLLFRLRRSRSSSSSSSDAHLSIDMVLLSQFAGKDFATVRTGPILLRASIAGAIFTCSIVFALFGG